MKWHKKMLGMVIAWGMVSNEIGAAEYLVPGWAINDPSFDWNAQIILPALKTVAIPLHKEILKPGKETNTKIKALLDEAKNKHGVGKILLKEDGTLDWDAMKAAPLTSSALVVQPDAYGMTALHYASYLGYAYIIDILLSYCDATQITEVLKVRDKYGRTPLHWAINRDGLAATEALRSIVGKAIDEKDPAIKKFLGLDYQATRTALSSKYPESDNKLGAYYANLGLLPEDIVSYLIEKGASLIAQDNAGRTPLHWATIYLKKEVVNVIVEAIKKSNITNLDIGDYVGATPLHYLSALRYVLDKDHIELPIGYEIGGASLTAQAMVEASMHMQRVTRVMGMAQNFKEVALVSQELAQNIGFLLSQANPLQAMQILGVFGAESVTGKNIAAAVTQLDDMIRAKNFIAAQEQAGVVRGMLRAAQTEARAAAGAQSAAVAARASQIMSGLAFFVITTVAIELLLHFVVEPALKKDAQQTARDKVHRHRDEMISSLLAAGANLNVVDNNKKGLLHYAAAMGNLSVSKILTGRSSSLVLAQDARGMYPVHYAALSNFTEGALDTIKLVQAIPPGGTLYAEAQDKLTPLLCAINAGNYEIIRYTVENAPSIAALFPSPQEGQSGVVTPLHYLMLQLGGSVTAKHKHHVDRDRQLENETVTMVALLETLFKKIDSFNDATKTARALIQQRDTGGRTALHYLAANSDDYIDQVFDDLSARGAGKKDAKTIGSYLKDTIGADNDGNTLLHMACASGREKLVKIFVNKYDFDPDLKNADIKDAAGVVLVAGRTPLEIARDSGFPGIVKFLAPYSGLKGKEHKEERKEVVQEAKVEQEINKKEEKKQRISANISKKEQKKAEKIEAKGEKKRWTQEEMDERLEKQTEMNKKKDKLEAAEEPLFIQAARTGRKEVVDTMIRQNTDLLMIDKDKKTALMHAAEKGHEKIVKAILDAAKKQNIQRQLVEMVDERGKTARDLTKNNQIKHMLAEIILQ